MDLIIDDDISKTQRKLSNEEYAQLEKNILADGKILDAITIWKGHDVIVDGENRYHLHKKHNIPFAHPPHELDFPDKQAVLNWIDMHQVGRRNLDGMQLTLVRARIFAQTGSAKSVAELHDVSARQIYRDAVIARTAEELPEDLAERMKKGELVASGRALESFAKLDPVQKSRVADQLRKDKAKSLNEVLPTKKPAITEEDREVINNTLSPEVRQKIALGGIKVDHKDVKRLAQLDELSKQTVDDVLGTSGAKDLGAAIDTLKPKGKRVQVPVDVDKLRTKIADTFVILRRLVDELGEAVHQKVEPVQDALKIAENNLP